MLIGTHTSDGAQNHVQIAQVLLPKSEAELDTKQYDDEQGEIGGHLGTTARVKVIQSINHDGEVNRARYCPQNPDLLATKSPNSHVFIFDRTRHPSVAPNDGTCRPEIILRGHTREGYGLSWSQTKEGHLLSASDDTTICHWDIQSYSKQSKYIDPLRIYRGHTAVVGDVAWHQSHDCLFASVGDDQQLMIWDTRSDDDLKPKSKTHAHTAEINSVSFNPGNEFLLLTGAADKVSGRWPTGPRANPYTFILDRGTLGLEES